jgi:carboxypeptidase C (cathepsin A)
MATEIGPCTIAPNLTTLPNPHSWNQNSHILVMSLPIGLGYSHSRFEEGTLHPLLNTFQSRNVTNSTTGLYPTTAPQEVVSSTSEVAKLAWNTLQFFYQSLRRIDPEIQPTKLNIVGQAHGGGRFGTAIASYLVKQNEAVSKGQLSGRVIDLNSLGIINGWIDAKIQLQHETAYLRQNTHDIKPINDTLLDWIDFSLTKKSGCLEMLDFCRALDTPSPSQGVISICESASALCAGNIKSTIMQYSNVSNLDIRAPGGQDIPPENFVGFLNSTTTKRRFGIPLRAIYSQRSSDVSFPFTISADWVRGDYLADLGKLADANITIALAYGDADAFSNWLGGEAVSLALDHGLRGAFRGAGYEPFVLDSQDREYGATRQAGKISFTRIYDAGNNGPYNQPEAYLAWFHRTIEGKTIPNGKATASKEFATKGPVKSTWNNKLKKHV